MPVEPYPTAKLLQVLSDSVSQIRAATTAVASSRLHAAPAPGEWSANEVLAHIRACADVRGGSINTILDEDEPVIRAINPLTWIKSTNYLEIGFGESFEAFARQRTELLARLEALDASDWLRAATVVGAGKPLRRTVQHYADWVARHERPHVRQLINAVK